MTAPETPEQLSQVLARLQAMAAARGVDAALVGGCLRDQLVGRAAVRRNVDIAVSRDAVALARALAEALGGTFVPLDDAQGTARVVTGAGADRLELDLSDFRGPTLEEDLRRRDFTINAMAVRLPDWLARSTEPHGWIDPLDGRKALAERRLTACFPETFRDDPLRILRAFRFAALLGFAFDAALAPLMRSAVDRLERVSGERIRDELLAIFEAPKAGWAVHELAALGALERIIPELAAGRGMAQGGYHHLDVLGHGLETVRQADEILEDFAEFSPRFREPLRTYCGEELVAGRSRRSLIKLAGLLHDVGKPATRDVHPDGEIWFLGHEHAGAQLASPIVERLRLSNREGQMVCQLVRHHLRPGFLSREPQLTRRALYRFYKDLGDDGPACVLTWWSDRLATRGPSSNVAQIPQQRARTEEILEPYFFRAEEIIRPPRLLDGHRVMQEFRLTAGPKVGALLALVEEAQAEGRIRTVDEALSLLRAHVAQDGTPPSGVAATS